MVEQRANYNEREGIAEGEAMIASVRSKNLFRQRIAPRAP